MSRSLLLHGVYRPGSSCFKEFLSCVECLLSAERSDVLIAGDVNMDLLADSRFRADYLNTVSSFGGTVGNNIVTRNRSNTLLDHFVSNSSTISFEHHTVPVDFSDHSAVFSCMDLFSPVPKYKGSRSLILTIIRYL
jgi:hypothetical protein